MCFLFVHGSHFLLTVPEVDVASYRVFVFQMKDNAFTLDGSCSFVWRKKKKVCVCLCKYLFSVNILSREGEMLCTHFVPVFIFYLFYYITISLNFVKLDRGYVGVGSEDIWEISVSFLQFCCKP